MEGTAELLKMTGICKAFSGVPALSNVDFSIKRGEVHAISGQNGAGKSTLIKILTGVYQKDKGEIVFNGKATANFATPLEAQNAGISTIYQELSVIPCLTIAENIVIGREKKKNGAIDWKSTREDAKKILSTLGIDVNVRELVSAQSVAMQQMISIARAVSTQAKLIVMDEPTSSLNEQEVNRLFEIIKTLKQNGISVIFITHRLDEIFKICDAVTILRDGELEGRYDIKELTKTSLILKMIGKTEDEFSVLNQKEPREIDFSKREEVLAAQDLEFANRVRGVSFALRRGEILGIAGLLGAGKTEMAKMVYGAIKKFSGKITIFGKVQKRKSPSAAVEQKIGFLSENRKEEGIFPILSMRENVTIRALSQISRFGVISNKKEKALVNEYIEKLNIKVADINASIRNLSGGNQQKAMLSRWICTHPKLLILDEPTRGVDVGAKLEIEKIIKSMAEDDVSIFTINSEIDQLARSSDRVLVVSNGKIIDELTYADVNEGAITAAVASVREEEASV